MTLHGWLRYAMLRHMLPANMHRVLEIGAGTGGVAKLLEREFEYVGLEPDSESHALAGNSVLNLSDEAFEGRDFDLVIALAVLEHIEDDVAALRRWANFLHPGGWVFVAVPHGTHLTATDIRVGHFRRYTRTSLTETLHAAGYSDVDARGYGFPVGALLHTVSDTAARLSRGGSMEQRTAESGRWMQPPPFLDPLYRATTAPFALMQRAFPGHGTGLVGMGHH